MMNERLLKGDCLDIIRKLEDNSIDTIITSPPYNKVGLRGGKRTSGKRWSNCGGNIDYNYYDDNMPESDYQNWQIEFLNECYRILKPTGSMFYNHKVRRYNNRGFFPKWVFDSDFKFYQLIIWNRKNNVDANIKYLNPTTELIFWLTKDVPNVYKNEAIHKTEVWDISPKVDKEHPAPFPLELAKNCILLTTDENDVVLDPFMGSGTTGIAAKELNRNFIGIEIDDTYFTLSKNRIENISSQINWSEIDKWLSL